MELFQQLAIPMSLIKLISGYLFHPGIDDMSIIKLIDYSDITMNLVFYFVEHDQVTEQITRYVNQNTHNMLLTLLKCYDHTKCEILRKIIVLTSAETIRCSYLRHYSTKEIIQEEGYCVEGNFDFNLLDEITIQSCMQRNQIFYEDFAKLCPIDSPFRYRIDTNWRRRIMEPNNGMYIAQRDIVEYFAKNDDTELLDFAIKVFKVDKQNVLVFVIGSCPSYIEMLDLPNLEKYIQSYRS